MKVRPVLILILALCLLPTQASAGCGKWVVRTNSDYDFLADPAFEGVNGTDQDPAPLRGAAAAAAAQKESEPALESAPASSQSGSAQALTYEDVSGKWAIRLNDSSSRYLDVILIQSGGKLQGYGSLIDQSTKLPLTATGLLSDGGLSLEAKLTQVLERTGPDKKYVIDLNQSTGVFSGVYEERVGDSLVEKGTVTASRP